METFPTTGLRVSTCSEPETVAVPPARLVTLTSKGTGPSRSVAAQDPTGTLKISADVAGQTAKVELASGASWQEPKASFPTATRSTAPLLAGNPLGGAACTLTWTVPAGPWETPAAAAAAAEAPRSPQGVGVGGGGGEAPAVLEGGGGGGREGGGISGRALGAGGAADGPSGFQAGPGRNAERPATRRKRPLEALASHRGDGREVAGGDQVRIVD